MIKNFEHDDAVLSGLNVYLKGPLRGTTCTERAHIISGERRVV